MLTEEQFNDVQQRLVSAWHKGNFARAFADADLVLNEGTPQMKGQCLFYRGLIRKDQGDLTEARKDWMVGLGYAQERTFLRYQLEYSLGKWCENSNESQQANKWYRLALETCAEAPDFSGHQALTGFLRVNGKDILQEDRPLITSVIEKSWRVLELPGKPALIDIAASIGEIDSGFKELITKTRGDTGL